LLCARAADFIFSAEMRLIRVLLQAKMAQPLYWSGICLGERVVAVWPV
jgi:hypothetical protein